MIELIKLQKKFGEKTAVCSLSLKIPQGKITTFLGPNGAGKTTTLKMVAGLLKPSSGTLSIFGKNYAEHGPEIKRKIAYIPDFPFLYPNLSAREFLEFIADLFGMPTNLSHPKIDEYLNLFELSKVQHQLTRQFSHGMKQRLVFCSAMIRSPKILIIDEPMVGLDPKTARLFKDLLLSMARNGVLIFLSTHQLHVAQELADNILIIKEGSILAHGTLEEIRSKWNSNKNLENIFLELTQ
jgi:ABC-2 type transport system ATP-binding protein